MKKLIFTLPILGLLITAGVYASAATVPETDSPVLVACIEPPHNEGL